MGRWLGEVDGKTMKYNPDIHHRRSIRMQEYDYSANGAYFVTICTQGRECLFGDISAGEMHLNEAGREVKTWWQKLPTKFDAVKVDGHIIMPNHFHGIISIVGAPPCGCPPLSLPCVGSSLILTSKPGQPHGDCPYGTLKPGWSHGVGNEGRSHGVEKDGRPRGAAPTLGDVMDWFKTMTTNAYIHGVKQSGWSPFPGRLWQRNYYERIIRDEKELASITEYIALNPMRWAEDKENPDVPTRFDNDT